LPRVAIAGAVIAILLGGCASQPQGPVEVTRLAGWGAYPPQAYIKVLHAPPAEPYVPVARLVVNGGAGLDRAQALTAMEQKARDLGANALVLTEETQPATPNLTFNPSGGSYSLTPPQSGSQFVGEAIHLSAADSQN
jgi:hypothetical protein